METIEFLFRNLGIEEGMVKETDLFLRNFIYTTIVIRKDLLEISERQRCIEKRMKKIGGASCRERVFRAV